MITVIMNIWKRNYFEEQLKAILGQTLMPERIWVIQYEEHVEIDNVLSVYKSKYPFIETIKCSMNLRYFGRFSVAVNVSTEFIQMIDDDIIPSSTWLETCVDKCRVHNSIICCSGRIIQNNSYTPELCTDEDLPKYFIADVAPLPFNYTECDVVVDYGCNSYFFRTQWLKNFWSIWPTTFGSGEDIHLSATSRIVAGIRTVVPAQPDASYSGNLRKEYGGDVYASWKQNNFIELRSAVVSNLINNCGWTPLLWEKKGR